MQEEPMIEGRAISEMKVVELKEELGKRGLSKIGNKNALHDRLKEYLLAELNAKDESERQQQQQSNVAAESPQRDLTSPPNPLVAEYLAKQQTALREARKDAEAVRRASSGDDVSPVRDKPVAATRRSRRARRESATSDSTITVVEEKLTEPVVTSETEQESLEAQLETHEVDSDTPLKVLKTKMDGSVDSVSQVATMKTPEETERTETEYDETKYGEIPHSNEPLDKDTASNIAIAEDASEEHEIQREQESKDEENDAVSDAGSTEEEEGSSRSQSRSEGGEESNDTFLEQTASDLQESSNQELTEAVDNTSVEKIEVMERIKGSAIVLSKTQTGVTSEKKRRWKPSEASHSENSIVTVSVTNHKEGEIEVDEQEDRPDMHSSIVSDFKEELSDSKDRMEELDYEEPMQSSVAEVAEEVKAAEELAEKRKSMIFEGVVGHAKRSGSHVRKRSPTPEKQQESHTTMDGFVRERKVSPARYPVNQVIMIRQLTRPYTVKQLQQLLSTFGTIVERGFWIDNIKSTCIVKYSTVEEAIVARGRLHNIVWPPCSPKALKVDYSDDANLAKHLAADQLHDESITKGSAEAKKSPPESAAPSLRVSLSVDERRRHVRSANQDESGKDLLKKEREGRGYERRGRKRSASPSGHLDAKRARERRSPCRDERRRSPASPEPKPSGPEKRVKTADELFMKTKTQPSIYYFPLTEEQIVERAERKAVETELAKKVAQNGTTSKRKERDELAKEKTSASKRPSAKSPPSRRRSRTPLSRRRSRTPVEQRDRRHSRSRSPRRRR